MSNIDPLERSLVGRWFFDGNAVTPDSTCIRIQNLLESQFVKLAESEFSGAWETLYLDPSDGRLWERTYPEGHLQGGGPPQICVISPEDAQQKYNFSLP